MLRSDNTVDGMLNAEQQPGGLKKGSLGVGALIFFVISATAPLTTLTGMFPLGFLYGNGIGYPVAYLVAMAILIVFSVGYLAIMRHVKSAGAFYALVSRGIGGRSGGAVALVMLLAYNAGQIGMQGLFGIATAGFMQVYLGVELPWWVFSFGAIFLIGLLGFRKVDLSFAVLGVLVVGEFLIVLAVDLGVVAKVGPDFSFVSFLPENIFSGSLPLALLMAIGSFIGFEATALYSEEAKDPSKTIPRATYLSLLIIGIFYCFSGMCIINGMGPGEIFQKFQGMADPTQFIYGLANDYVSPTSTIYVHFLLVTSTFASMLAFHNAAARYFYVLGREGVLPKPLGATHERHASPHVGSLTQTTIAFIVVGIFAIGQLDPMATLFAWLGSVGILGIIGMTSVVSLAVVMFFVRNPDLERSGFSTKIAPSIASVMLALIAISIAMNFGMFSGASGWIGVALPSSLLLIALVGWYQASRLKSRDPERFKALGANKY